MANGCFVKAMTYWISLRVRISSEVPLSYYVQLKAPKADGSGWTGKTPLECPAQTKSDGWVTCSGPYVIEEDLSIDVIDEDFYFEVIFDWRTDNGPVWATVDYDDISMKFMAGVSIFLTSPSTTDLHSKHSLWFVHSSLSLLYSLRKDSVLTAKLCPSGAPRRMSTLPHQQSPIETHRMLSLILLQLMPMGMLQ
jgi:hypothetical protein